MMAFPLYYSDLLLAKLVIELVWVVVGYMAIEAVVIELVRVQDFAVEMELVVEGMDAKGNVVDISLEDKLDMDRMVEMVGHILSNLGFEFEGAKFAMA